MGSMRTIGVLAICAACFTLWAAADDSSAHPKVKFEVRLAEDKSAEGLTEAVAPGEKRKVYMHKEAVLTNGDITEARAFKENRDGNSEIDLVLTKSSGERFGQITEKHLDKPLVVLLDGKVLLIATVRSKISQKMVFTARLGKGEADRIVQGILGK